MEDALLRRRQAEEQARERLEERSDRLKTAGVEGCITDEDWERIVNDRLDHSRSLNAVEAWLKERTLYLALFGTTGCGKTVACAWGIARVGGRYVQAKKLERLFAAMYGSALQEQDALMERHGLLVIDDVGTELNPQTFASSLYEVLDRRQGSGRRTIITANMAKGDFEKRYTDSRLLSRMKRADVVGDTSEDRRRKK